MYNIEHFVGGSAFAGSGDRSGDIYNPATGEVQGQVNFASVQDVDKAAAAASDAFASWSKTSIMKRVGILFKFRELLEQNKDRLTEMLVKEHGKVWDDAAGELQRGFEVVEFACGIPQLLKGEYSAGVGGGIDSYSMRLPLGVVAAITPFNFPAMVPLWTAPIAIACGNTYILKPSEKDPSCASLIADIFAQAGLQMVCSMWCTETRLPLTASWNTLTFRR